MKMVKVISIVVVMALLLQILPMQILGAELRTVIANDQVEAMTDTVDASVKIAGEVVEKRTKFAKEYTLTNGLHMAVVYPEAVHYESGGRWLEIDNTLQAVGTGLTGIYTNRAGEWSVSFPQQLNPDNRVSVTKNGYSVSFGMAGEVRKEVALTKSSVTQEIDEISVVSAKSTTAQIQTLKTAHLEELQFPETIQDKVRSRLQYSTVYNQTDIIYDVTPSQVKESIVINSFDPLVQGYRYVLELDGLVPILKNDNSIDLVDAETKEVIMQMPAPYMVDASDAVSLDVKVSLERDRDAYVLSYEMPMQWLAEEERQWPVVLDPVVTASVDVNNILDQTVMENYSISYTSGALYAGYRSGWGKMRTYLQYSQLPELSSADVIVSASVSLYVNNATGTGIVAGTNTGTPIEVRGVSGAWNSSTITWNTKPEASDTVQDYAIVTNSGRHFWDITDLARGWYEGTNTGLVFKGVDSVESGSTDEFKKFYSVDYSTYDTGIDPQLCIIFRNNNGLESYWDYTAASAGRAGTGYVNNYTGNLVWTRHDLGFGGNRMPVSINHIYNANDSTNNSSSVGNGWRTNFHQVVYAWNHENAVGEYMAWIDGDGTIHYFEKQTDGTYKDEDGLELTLVRTSTASGNLSCYITDKDGNTSYFNSTGKLIEQRNNQSTTSSITITYDTSGRITKIEDGISRDYVFTYTNGNLTRISYRGTGTTEVSYVTFAYSGSNLTKITDADGKATQFTYTTKNLLSGVTDVDGYNLTYAYDTTVAGKPSRVIRMEEKDGTKTGGLLTFVYGQNQTTITDHNNNRQTLQFNNWGNTISIYDNQGRAQYGQYALNDPLDASTTAATLSTDPTAKGNQLRLSSKMQNTVANMLQNGSFETGSAWTAINTSVTRSISTVAAYMGNKSMAVTRSASGTASGVYTTFTAAAGATYTFSAYVKTGAGSAYLALKVDSSTVTSEVLAANSGWTRLQVSYTNTSSAAKTVTAQFLTAQAGTSYIDCAQIEKAPTASRYNLVENGDFRYSGSPASGWTSSGLSAADVRATSTPAAAPQLDTSVFSITGNYATAKTLSQTVTVKGSAKDSYVLSGWAKGNSVPLGAKNGVTREFGLKLIFNHTDGTTDPHYISFNCDLPSDESWQYIATAAVAKKAYSSITVQLVYSRNANTVYFDGIQLFKEQFGTSYAYDANGNIKSVIDLQKQETTYQYQNNNLSKVIQNGKAKMTYEYYDNSNNVKTATTSEGVIYRFNYDKYGNNTSVAITNGSASITSYATYTSDGNRLVSTKDALDNVTKYSYNINTNVLEWVEYPEDTTGTRTQYTYDAIYRLAQEAVAVSPSGNSMSASYTYTDDQLTKLQTASTVYNFTYGDFSLRTGVSVGTRTLVTYSYTNDRNRYLQRMTYGNGDYVQYAYDSQGRVVSETYEDGSVVTYTYDNSGALATVTDSETGITSKYYYDLTDRMMKYAESDGSVEHSVGYTYDSLNNLTTLLETIGTVKHSTTYDYDDDNRVVSVANSVTGGSSSQNSKREYTYDAFGRISRRITKHNNTQLMTESFTYVGNSTQVASITVSTGNYSVTYSYTYDANGNIATVTNGSNSTRYQYDSANQLVREDNKSANATWMWQYNNGGNITSYLAYNYSLAAETSIQPTATKTNTYGNSTWGDLLTKSGTSSYSYDTIGNLASNGQWNFTWKHGRELVSMTNSTGTAWNFRYDANGMRISRTSSAGVTYSYVYNGGQLIQMTRGSTVYQFTYDASGTPMTISQNGTVYYYVTNLQGDVVAILNSSGTAVTQYTYDAWGKLLTATGSQASGVGTYNPLRYRGYVYDQETGLYYLQSRYYDPTLGRFLNADVYTSTGQGLLGNNMFAYCNNNPVNGCDPCGTCFHRWDFWNDCAQCGGRTIGDKWDSAVQWCESVYNFVMNDDTAAVQQNLKQNNFSFYKGAMVFSASLSVDRSGFSFGAIVLDDYYESAPQSSFSETLNHEYGHFLHMQQIGPATYTSTTAIPSLISAAIADSDGNGIQRWMSDNYYNLPAERIADQLGGVNRGYAPSANTIGSLYWIYTIAISLIS